MSSKHLILDSHIHLWPASAADANGHAWMSDPDFILSKQHILSDYTSASSANPPTGVVYVETDRRLEDPSSSSLESWASEAVKELQFLRSIVEGDYGSEASALLQGIVTWAPVHQGQDVFSQWLEKAEETTGPETWGRIKGFRFLLQAITDKTEFENLVFSDGFISILKSLGRHEKKFSFDVGIDQRSGGTWQLETFTKVVEKVYEGVPDEERTVLILNHMCKPSYTSTSSDSFARWKSCIQNFASHPQAYMKLSGAFSELSDDASPVNTVDPNVLAQRMKPWTDVVFDAFGPQRVMFGSDWPVCNVKGPKGEGSWPVWTSVVEEVLSQRKCTEAEKARVWSGTAKEAYKL
ncbi:hypothetical protein D6C86_01331 [Aureobasidium pullulans]|uniref:Amidohydrolase-related domain-containing protein n=1 Tax=Aureobasidium pullulans TaxID=5580 RepID=A0A4S9Q4H8_AURPU|nr:hypothetical protein D6C94_01198 [Aureobasidium pullulans]THZ49153.1 hypothetical protein D6C87_00127 [Aureobasidium pullulans]THZ66130.1 hypothetical protein D6C86_01331 [Aureobasidium pullulans]THZ86867.1 hypothetical protein D6C88_05310 [Aureobasidium pullulans]